MSQATPQIDQFIHWLQGSSLSVYHSPSVQRWRDRLSQKLSQELSERFNQVSWGWVASLAGLLLLWAWNWQFVLAIALGLAVLVWSYLALQGWWRPRSWQKLQRLWSRANRSLTIATIGGLLTAFGSYVAIGIWRENHSWLATGLILEGLLSVAILGLLLWRMRQVEVQGCTLPTALPDDRLLNPAFADLTERDPLQRLVAVRQLTHLFTRSAAEPLPMSPAHLAECFRLMLNRETEPLVCSALLEGLQALSDDAQRPSVLKAAKSDAFGQRRSAE